MTIGRRPPPRSHWLLLTAGLTVIALLLLAQTLVLGQSGEGHGGSSGHGTPVPQVLLDGGPVLDTGRLGEPGVSAGDRMVALTFDDGPSEYTGKILDVLERHQVPATFFVIGSQVAERPGLVRRMAADGDDIGLHTFTHPDLGAVPAWRERMELSQSQQVLAASTGRTTNLLRLPFSSTPSALSGTKVQALRRAGNYRAVFTDLDTRDWERPGVAAIVTAASPRSSAGKIVMLHDGGGDRTETVAAIEVLIPRLQAQGYRFTTVSRAIGAGSPFSTATRTERLRGWVVLDTLRAGSLLGLLLSVVMIVVAALSVLRLLLLVLIARRHARADFRPQTVAQLSYQPAVSVVVPAYNEAVGIAAAVRSLAASSYPDVEIIVVDDGSTDGTAAIVRALELPCVRVVEQPNGGKPAALNTGIASAVGDILVLVDGDTVFEPGTVGALVASLADPEVGAVSGNTKVGNRGGLIGRWQHIEYVIGFNLDRRMFDVLRCMPTIPGAVGAFRREVLAEVGGVSDSTLAEDTDLTMAICRAGWRVVYQPMAVAWTEAPSSLGQLWRQRYRWCYGTLQAMWKHRGAVWAPGAAGNLGRRGLPYLLLFQVLLPMLAPVVDLAAVYGLFFSDSRRLAVTWSIFLLLQLSAALYAFALDRESPRPLWALLTQQLVYRQLMYLVVLQSLASAVYGVRLRWHTNPRTGQLDARTRSHAG